MPPELALRTLSSLRHTTRFLEAGPVEGPLIVFLHGWPEIGLIVARAGAGVRVGRLAMRRAGHARLRRLDRPG